MFTYKASDGADIAVYVWPTEAPLAAVQIAHGMGEHAARYNRLANALNQAGYVVYANDHRGHGATTGLGRLGYLGGDGWNRVVADAYELNRYIATQYTGLPIVLLGHSMGAMMSQLYVTRHGDSISGLVLSGSPGFKSVLSGWLSRIIARIESARLGATGESALMQKLIFGSNNKPFERSGPTGFEWLSRDARAVEAYVQDEACGFVLTVGSLLDLFNGSAMNSRPEVLAKMPKSLPIYVLSGTEDPVHGKQRDINRMLKAFYNQGLSRVVVKWYTNGRHEMFNETNRDTVVADLIQWLKSL